MPLSSSVSNPYAGNDIVSPTFNKNSDRWKHRVNTVIADTMQLHTFIKRRSLKLSGTLAGRMIPGQSRSCFPDGHVEMLLEKIEVTSTSTELESVKAF